jgi:hypothetical protein
MDTAVTSKKPTGDEAAPKLQLGDILKTEHAAIKARRTKMERPVPAVRVALVKGDRCPHDPYKDINGADPAAPEQTQTFDTVGLALSGGGVRSASFCLGALQAMETRGALGSVDYLSTVSGGGYTGCSTVASMSANGGTFPFVRSGDHGDTPAVAHLRNYSNYLLPRSHSLLRNVTETIAILGRGIVANVVSAAWVMLLLVALIAYLHPNHGDLVRGPLVYPSRAAALVTMLVELWIFVWVVRRAWPDHTRSRRDHSRQWLNWSKLAVVALVLAVALIALHRFAAGYLAAMIVWAKGTYQGRPFDSALAAAGLLGLLLFAWAVRRSLQSNESQYNSNDATSVWLGWSSIAVKLLVGVAALELLPVLVHGYMNSGQIGSSAFAVGNLMTGLAVLVPAVAAFAGKISAFLNTSSRTSATPVVVQRVLAKIALWGAALVMPTLLLLALLDLTSRFVKSGKTWDPPPWALPAANAARLPNWWAELVVQPWFLALLVGLLVAAVAVLLDSNKYSLHQYYRDRLAKAFLFGPADETEKTLIPGKSTKPQIPLPEHFHRAPPDDPALLKAGSFSATLPLHTIRFSDLRAELSPYLIVNATLNLQGSAVANQRGRSADFFTFTRDFVGSRLTNYVSQDRIEVTDPHLDLGSAMAISGAAASSNMGSNTIPLLAPTLTFLNIRLGYWMANPKFPALGTDLWSGLQAAVKRRWFLINETFGKLDENAPYIYLTDGGHNENLGAYELLRRGCKLIIVVDAEADPEYSFSSLLRLERYARIDLGIRIDLPWPDIRDANRTLDKIYADGEKSPRVHGPHAAIGRINYNNGVKGTLLYIKSSMSGDEPDYVKDYKRRNNQFPQETTLDQFFSEEQMEVYRALGFHAVERLLDGADDVAWVSTGPNAWDSCADARAEAFAPLWTMTPKPLAASRALVGAGAAIPR